VPQLLLDEERTHKQPADVKRHAAATLGAAAALAHTTNCYTKPGPESHTLRRQVVEALLTAGPTKDVDIARSSSMMNK
jgi:hypothetical protein